MESDIDLAELLVSENSGEEWIDVEFEVALDSGSIVHVCRDSDAPGYVLESQQEAEGAKTSWLETARKCQTWGRSA